MKPKQTQKPCNHPETSEALKTKQSQNLRSNGRKQNQDTATQKKRTNGVHSQPAKQNHTLKCEKKLHPRRLQDNFETDAAHEMCSSSEDPVVENVEGNSVACNGNYKFAFSSRAFLSFKFDHDAIMKCFDPWVYYEQRSDLPIAIAGGSYPALLFLRSFFLLLLLFFLYFIICF